jgi:hypothetical protein
MVVFVFNMKLQYCKCFLCVASRCRSIVFLDSFFLVVYSHFENVPTNVFYKICNS